MAARVAAIDLDLEAIDTQRTALGPGNGPTYELAHLLREEESQEFIHKEALRRWHDIVGSGEKEAQALVVQQADRRLKETQSRRCHLRFELGVALEDAKGIQQQLQNLDLRQAVLEKERVTCCHIITAEAFHSSPIRRVHDDILAEIFGAATASEPDRVGTGVAVAAQVCARSRNVAFAHPSLWSTFSFLLFGSEATVNLLQITLGRCKAAPLSVVVNAYEKADTGSSGHLKMALLAEHAENIINLRFIGQDRFINNLPSLDAFRGRLVRLQLLGFSHTWRTLGDVFEGAPCLRTLELGRSATLLELKSRLPIAQIESMRFHESTNGYHLVSFPNLTSMESIQTAESHPVGLLKDAPELPALTTWRVEFPKPREADSNRFMYREYPSAPPPNSAVNFFARFQTPALRTLELCRLTAVEGVVQMLRRSMCKLVTLVLEEPLITPDELLRLLAATPDLHMLEITSGQSTALDDKFINALAIRNDPLNNLLPCLKHLRLDGSYQFDTDTLLEMLQSRASAGSAGTIRLREADITLRDRVINLDSVRALARLDDCAITITGAMH